MNLIDFLPLLAGIGLFLYGMSVLGSSLEKIAGAGLEKMLERLTNSRIKGVALGTAVTGVIQSSSATSIMVIGLLNAGIMKLTNAVPVVMGANIGTTVTGQILRLGDLEGSGVLLQLLKPSSFGPVLIGLGAFFVVFCKKRKKKDIGLILLGLGMIFFGMNTMEKTLSPLKDMPWFTNMFFIFKNPFLGIILGVVMTAVIQSSSASVGILQALSSTGAITFSTAVPIILGMNVGKCVTVVLASVGSKRDAKRVVAIDVMSNIIGLVVFFVLIYGLNGIIHFSFWDMSMTRGNIADFHTFFNVGTTLMLIPFVNVLIKLSKKIVGDSAVSEGEKELMLLDDYFLLKTPHLAVEQTKKVIGTMADLAQSNITDAMKLIFNYDDKLFDKINENESLMDRFEASLSNYLVKITSGELDDRDNAVATEMLHSLSDFERLSDHAINIAEVAQYNFENGLSFSEPAQKELSTMCGAVDEILSIAVEAYINRDYEKSTQVEPLEEIIDTIHFDLKDRHIKRLCDGKCSIPAGISFLELLTNFERISDHCSNIALYIIQSEELYSVESNGHEIIEKMHSEPSAQYTKYYNHYLNKYRV